MSKKTNEEEFDEIYNNTYKKIQMYVTCRCSRTDYIVDIIQEIYLHIYKTICRKGADFIKNKEAFAMQVAKHKIYSYYTLMERFKNIISINSKSNEEYINEDIEKVDNFFENELEKSIISKDKLELVWNYIQGKNEETKKVFYLFYYCDMSIKEISKNLNISESNVKNKIYRTTNEIRKKFGNEED